MILIITIYNNNNNNNNNDNNNINNHSKLQQNSQGRFQDRGRSNYTIEKKFRK